MGLDVLAFTDQMQGNLPTDLWSELPQAAFLPYPHAMLDAALVMTLAAARTKSMELYLGAIDFVRHPPSKLAQTFLTIHEAAEGRAMFALGASEAKNVVPYGHSRKGSAKKFEESLAIMRLLLDSGGAPVTYAGEHYSMKGGVLQVEPWGGVPPKVLAATGGTEETLALVGNYADGLLTHLPGFVPGGPEQFANDREIIRQAAERAGRDPDALRFASSVMLAMHDDEDMLRRVAETLPLKWDTIVYGRTFGRQWRDAGFEHPLGDEWGYARHLVPERYSAEEIRRACDAVPVDAVLNLGRFSGSAEDCADQLAPYVEAGLQYAFLVDTVPLGDPTLANDSAANLDRFAKRLRGRGLTEAPLGYLGVGQDA
jgi:phthiodiolone/phenolphthiodiolone dimycocerosates ketoreductase